MTKEYLRSEHGRAELFLEEPAFYAENEIDLRTDCEATRLDPGGTIRTANGEELSFSACVLATGSEPTRLPIPGGNHEELLTLRELEDSEFLQVRAISGATVSVVGSGFIGCEAAASLATRGAQVTLVSDEVLPQGTRLGRQVGETLAEWLREAGVRMLMGRAVERFEDGGRRVVTSDGDVAGDMTIVAAGARPRTGLAKDAGLAIEKGRVRTDSSLRTGAAGVFAAGDVALALNSAAGRRLVVEHWGEALAQGEVAGKVAAGAQARWQHAPGFWSTVGEHTIKYVAWGDGHDTVRVDRGDDGSFAAWYGQRGVVVGVLTHERDDDYERGRELVEAGGQLP